MMQIIECSNKKKIEIEKDLLLKCCIYRNFRKNNDIFDNFMVEFEQEEMKLFRNLLKSNSLLEFFSKYPEKSKYEIGLFVGGISNYLGYDIIINNNEELFTYMINNEKNIIQNVECDKNEEILVEKKLLLKCCTYRNFMEENIQDNKFFVLFEKEDIKLFRKFLISNIYSYANFFKNYPMKLKIKIGLKIAEIADYLEYDKFINDINDNNDNNDNEFFIIMIKNIFIETNINEILKKLYVYCIIQYLYNNHILNEKINWKNIIYLCNNVETVNVYVQNKLFYILLEMGGYSNHTSLEKYKGVSQYFKNEKDLDNYSWIITKILQSDNNQ